MRMTAFFWLSLMVAIVGCVSEPGPVECDPGYVPNEAADGCVLASDMGVDMADDIPTDSSSDTSECSCEEGFVCDEGGNCIQCNDEHPCAEGFCSTDSLCVACDETEHLCQDSANSRCDVTGDSPACLPCEDNTHCAHIEGMNICNSGQCVQCSVDDSSACEEGTVCDLLVGSPTQFTCVTSEPLGNCEPCVNDAQCDEHSRCLPATFTPLGGEEAEMGYRCLPIRDPNCVNPYLETEVVDSINNENVEGCFLRFTTCEAYQAFQSSCTTDADCGAEGVEDGFCREDSAANRQCTYRCGAPNECTVGSASYRCEVDSEISPDQLCSFQTR